MVTTIRVAVAEPKTPNSMYTLLDNFNWPKSDTVHFYSDWEPYSFFFQESRSEGDGSCGGLILHHSSGMKDA